MVGARCYASLSITYKMQENYDEAIANISKAIELETDNFEWYEDRAEIYDLSGEKELAEKDRETAAGLK